MPWWIFMSYSPQQQLWNIPLFQWTGLGQKLLTLYQSFCFWCKHLNKSNRLNYKNCSSSCCFYFLFLFFLFITGALLPPTGYSVKPHMTSAWWTWQSSWPLEITCSVVIGKRQSRSTYYTKITIIYRHKHYRSKKEKNL